MPGLACVLATVNSPQQHTEVCQFSANLGVAVQGHAVCSGPSVLFSKGWANLRPHPRWAAHPIFKAQTIQNSLISPIFAHQQLWLPLSRKFLKPENHHSQAQPWAVSCPGLTIVKPSKGRSPVQASVPWCFSSAQPGGAVKNMLEMSYTLTWYQSCIRVWLLFKMSIY